MGLYYRARPTHAQKTAVVLSAILYVEERGMSRPLEKVREELEYVRVYYWAVRDSKGKKNFKFLDPKIDIAVAEYNQAIAKLENIKLFAVYTQIYIQGLKQKDLAKA